LWRNRALFDFHAAIKTPVMSNSINNMANNNMELYQAFLPSGISDDCLSNILFIKSNNVDTDDFSLSSFDAETFTDQAWTLLGRYIANNTHLVEIDLNGCHLTDGKMSFLFRELVGSTSLKTLLLSDNDFGMIGVRSMIPLLQNSPNLSTLALGSNQNINNECFEVLVSALHGKSIRELYIYGCNITDASALNPCHLPNLQKLDLDGNNNISKEGCITLSNLLQKEGSTLAKLDLNCTGLDDEGIEILATSLKHNTKLKTLNLQENNDITERGLKSILKLMVDVSSIESTYNSNHTLSVCGISGISGNANTKKLKLLINSACNVNRAWSTAEAVGRAKVIKYHLNSQKLKELCQLQGVEYSDGNLFADIEPKLLPEILALIGDEHEQSDLFTALIHTAPDLLSYIDRKALINNEMENVKAQRAALKDECAQKVAEYERKIAALKTEMLTETSRLNDKKADLSSRLELIDLGDIKQSAIGGDKGNGLVDSSSKKRQRS